MKSYIYVIENLINGKAYVGKANNVLRRWKNHQGAAYKDIPQPQTALYRAMRKYGIENFQIHTVDEHEDENYVLSILEPEWINYLRVMKVFLYNLTEGGDGCPGMKHSLETKSKIGTANKGKIRSVENRLQIRNTLLGRIVPQCQRDKISLANKGKKKPKRTEEHCKNISKGKKGVALSQESKEKISQGMKNSSKVGHLLDEETRRKISEKLKNQKQSPQTIAKRAESMRRYYSEKREKASAEAKRTLLKESLFLEPKNITLSGSTEPILGDLEDTFTKGF